MGRVVQPYCAFVPPHMETLLQQGFSDNGDDFLQSLLVSTQLRGRREQAARSPGSAGDSDRPAQYFIYDADNKKEIPGEPIGDPTSSPDQSVIEANGGIRRTLRLFESFGRRSIDGAGSPLAAVVNYGRNFSNAIWTGEEVILGDGDDRFTARFTTLDIVAHEISHGVVQNTAKLEYRRQSGALNESFSDVFGVLVRLKKEDRAELRDEDWVVGRGIFRVSNSFDRTFGIRSMKFPGTAYENHAVFGDDRQVGAMSDFVDTSDDNGGVHFNSGIPNRAFVLATETMIRESGCRAWEDPGQIWYESLLKLNSKSNFEDIAEATISVARTKGSLHESAVRKAWEETEVLKPLVSTRAAGDRVPLGRRGLSLEPAPRPERELPAELDTELDTEFWDEVVERVADSIISKLADRIAERVAQRLEDEIIARLEGALDGGDGDGDKQERPSTKKKSPRRKATRRKVSPNKTKAARGRSGSK